MSSILVTLPYVVCDIYTQLPSNITWMLSTLPCGKKDYDVYACEVDSKVYIKPYKKYNQYEFETLFNFECNCGNYDENKVVWVKDAKLK